MTTTTTRRLTKVMGCRATLRVSAASRRESDRLLALAVRRLRQLEGCWSRFLPESDVSRLNRAGGRMVDVDPATVVLVSAMATAMRVTAGAFDPTLLGTIVGLGYGPAWSGGAGRCSLASPGQDLPRRIDWIGETMVDVDASRVAIPCEVQLDPGAIGKGLAADIVADELSDAGALAVAAAIGGDVRTSAPATVGIAAPDGSGRIVDRIRLASGGVATSGTGRRWIGPDGRVVHHVLDPRTRRPVRRCDSDEIVQMSVAAASGASAEVWATAAFVDGPARIAERLDRWGVAALAIAQDGSQAPNSAWRLLRAVPVNHCVRAVAV